ncbi:thiamine pyrophosphate-dependent enzyme [Micromonosporaceae bacterium B7E4]
MSPTHESVLRYRAMLEIRELELRCFQASREGLTFGSVHPCAGQEAVPVGVVSQLGDADVVFSTYRGHGWALALGVPPDAVLAEVAHRGAGTNGGRSGTAYLSSPQHRFMGENSIVGAGVPIAAGAALAAQRRSSGATAVVSIGDGAMNQGSVTEGLAFAAVERLPLLVVCENNGWAEMSPTSDMTRTQTMAERAAGLGIAHRVVDGTDPQSVAEGTRWALQLTRSGTGPAFLECMAPRLWGHHQNDIQQYRSKEDKDHAVAGDPISKARAVLIADGIATDEFLTALDREVASQYDAIFTQVSEMPEPSPADVTAHLTSEARPAEPGPLGESKRMTYQRAANAALESELAERDDLIVYGEDVAIPGGVFGVTRGLFKKFGRERIFDTPIAESAILGSAVGAALSGMRPVVEIMWADFMLVALDQLVNQAANVRYISRGQLTAPMVVRMQQGATPGSCAQHSQSLEALLTHIPGLKVGMPADAGDAYAMLRAAVADEDPCIVIESRELYQTEGEVYLDEAVQPVHGGRTLRDGDGPAIITWGAMVYRALQAADQLAAEGIHASVHNLRWLNPVDDPLLAAAVQMSSGRVIVAHEANLTGGYGAEIAARIQSDHFAALARPVHRIGAPDIRVPSAPALQAAVIPGVDTIVATVRAMAGTQEPVEGGVAV